MKLKGFWFVADLLNLFGVAQQYKKNTEDWLQIQVAMVWLKGIHFAREFVIDQVAVMACVITLILSALLIEAAFVFCLPIALQSKLITLFVVAGINFSIAIGLLGYFLAAERWVKQAAKYNTYILDYFDKTK